MVEDRNRMKKKWKFSKIAKSIKKCQKVSKKYRVLLLKPVLAEKI